MRDRAVPHRIDAANLEWIETELFRADIDMGLSGESGLQRAERTERA